MFRYEIFRQSVAGWFLICSFLLIGYPYLKFQEYTTLNLGILFIGSLLLSPVFGYLTSQGIRAFFIFTNTRPNDTMINIRQLHKKFLELTNNLEEGNSPLKVLQKLSPKELHRFVWVAYANKDLRVRSESYWERYYTNLNIVAVSIAGLLAALVFVVPIEDVLKSLNIAKYAVILTLAVVFWYNNRKYLSICANLENTWINTFLEKLQIDQKYFLDELFKR